MKIKIASRFVPLLSGWSLYTALFVPIVYSAPDPQNVLQQAQKLCDKDPNTLLKDYCYAQTFGGLLVPEEAVLARKEDILLCKEHSGLTSKDYAQCILKSLPLLDRYTPETTNCEPLTRCLNVFEQALIKPVLPLCTKAFSENHLRSECYKGISETAQRHLFSILRQNRNEHEEIDDIFLNIQLWEQWETYQDKDFYGSAWRLYKWKRYWAVAGPPLALLCFLLYWLSQKIIAFYFPLVSEKKWRRRTTRRLKGPLKNIADVYFGMDVQDAEYFNHRDVFQIHLIAILACVIKRDSKVEKSEINAALQGFINSHFESAQVPRFTKTLMFALNQDFDLDDICKSFRDISQYFERLLLLRIIREIAQADGPITPDEKEIIKLIADILEIQAGDQRTTNAEFVQSADQYHQILGVRANASEMEIKRAYRKLALKHHPDRAAHLGKEYVQMATKQMQIINAAYEKILADKKKTV